MPTALFVVSEHSEASRPTFFHSAATCLHVLAKLTPEPAKHEARKRRTSERHVVGCCEVLAAAPWTDATRLRKGNVYLTICAID